ncbi:MAG: 2-oxo-4-hydroxy-4-carboxy-5-ureidoimidazoline decarboxylase [Paraglaciecola sp.]|uniref:2-oxo-4-hydroxy-4-carboxy-5-ureidoimidazoline decarboxylase n=1 Tax=Paraglaciecola sp. TaxID=1920173 RepID=UPI00273DBABA|nr:2-oxo-4-hydroxy-4-carboxy-5-ureidoimidazoline decarboxylase [Paraglaciecola sp.]MDP5031616.1 2-oxo-4-hydroxy-4-carboxy-5-ureidoimidazoline decarboxylase [Paraglaciecola sp.]MDP5041154.1 2-oxo-4-hydroxy-4-carboxy-5-ureidoimidazoline decarboxylase [Paraglaciecola sp.]MDP5131267.1 2-oxo-4-hydroxy-4-carboxy-5-ureidoimidazoline decarboxylase [Paraglaciecola sp.]
MTLSELNELPSDEAFSWFSQCCVSSHWCKLMVDALPFSDLASLLSWAQQNWQACSKLDYLEAFDGHPMIGDVASLRAKYASTKALASKEQQGAAEADEATLIELSEMNHKYLAKHGFIFIICATGLSALTMLNALKARYDNDTATEISLAAAEQLKITLLRINKGLSH